MNSRFYPFCRATNQFCSVPGLDGWPECAAFLCVECLVFLTCAVHVFYVNACNCSRRLFVVQRWTCCRSLDQRVIASTFCHSKSCTQLDIYFVVVVGITHNNSVHLALCLGLLALAANLFEKTEQKGRATALTTRVQSGICHTIQIHTQARHRSQGPSHSSVNPELS